MPVVVPVGNAPAFGAVRATGVAPVAISSARVRFGRRRISSEDEGDSGDDYRKRGTDLRLSHLRTVQPARAPEDSDNAQLVMHNGRLPAT